MLPKLLFRCKFDSPQLKLSLNFILKISFLHKWMGWDMPFIHGRRRRGRFMVLLAELRCKTKLPGSFNSHTFKQLQFVISPGKLKMTLVEKVVALYIENIIFFWMDMYPFLLEYEIFFSLTKPPASFHLLFLCLEVYLMTLDSVPLRYLKDKWPPGGTQENKMIKKFCWKVFILHHFNFEIKIKRFGVCFSLKIFGIVKILLFWQ